MRIEIALHFSFLTHPAKAYLTGHRNVSHGIRKKYGFLFSIPALRPLAIACGRVRAGRHGTEKRNPYFPETACLGTVLRMKLTSIPHPG